MTHTQYCGRRVDGEKCSNSYIKTVVKNASPTDSLLQHYNYDIANCPQGVVAPPCWTLPKG